MSEIRVRAWHKAKGEYVYDNVWHEVILLGLDNEMGCKCQPRCKEIDHFIGLPANCPIFEYELCMGRFDKNGKPLYEGDIIETTRYKKSVRGLIKKERDCWTVLCGKALYRFFDFVKFKDIEIVGTAHENPELLGG